MFNKKFKNETREFDDDFQEVVDWVEDYIFIHFYQEMDVSKILYDKNSGIRIYLHNSNVSIFIPKKEIPYSIISIISNTNDSHCNYGKIKQRTQNNKNIPNAWKYIICQGFLKKNEGYFLSKINEDFGWLGKFRLSNIHHEYCNISVSNVKEKSFSSITSVSFNIAFNDIIENKSVETIYSTSICPIITDKLYDYTYKIKDKELEQYINKKFNDELLAVSDLLKTTVYFDKDNLNFDYDGIPCYMEYRIEKNLYGSIVRSPSNKGEAVIVLKENADISDKVSGVNIYNCIMNSSAKFTKHFDKTNKIISNHNNVANLLVNGLKTLKKIDGGKLNLKTHMGKPVNASNKKYKNYFKTFIKNGKETIQLLPEYEQKIKYIKSKKYKSCVDFINQSFKKYSINPIYISGEGLLFGNTQIRFTKTNDIGLSESVEYTFELPNCFDGVREWKKLFIKQLSDNAKKIDNTLKKEMDEIYSSWTQLAGNYLDTDIMMFVEKNESYITPNAVVQALRGVTVQLNTAIYETKGCGIYNIYPAQIILKQIESLVKKGWLYTKQLKGTYGKFDILKMTQKGTDFVKFMKDYKVDADVKKEKKKWVNTERAYEYRLNEIMAKSNREIKDYITLSEFVACPSFIMNNSDKYFSAFSGINDKAQRKALVDFLKMKSSVEKDSAVVKLYKKIIKQIKS